MKKATAEKEVLHRMLEDQRRFDHAILDGVEVGIITTAEDGRITFMNRHARELLRISGEVTPLAIQEVFGLVFGPGDLLGDQDRTTLSSPLITPDGVELDLELSITRGEDHDARVGFFVIFRDVLVEKTREAERSRFERLAAMGTMVAGFAHEVRNPVAALRSIAEELGEELIARKIDLPHAHHMVTVLERIERLVRTWLRFGRPAAPKRLAHPPRKLCSSALSGMSQRTAPLQQEIIVDVEPNLPDVFVDNEQIMQALVILLDNAIDATGAPDRVKLRASSRGRSIDSESRRKTLPPLAEGLLPSFVRFEVIDDGPGISPEMLSRIFDPFFTTKPSGTGLGLAIAQQIVSENNGHLEVSAARGNPTTFAILLPVAQ